MRRMSKEFFVGSFISSFVLVLILYGVGYAIMIAARLAQDTEPPFAAIGMICFGQVPLIYLVVVLMIFIYRIWSEIQDGQVRTTPGKAIGYMFIPFFNIYWLFMVYWGWAQDYNRYIAQRNLALPKMSERLALAVCVCSVIPCLSIANLVLMPMFISSACDAVNALVDARMSPPANA